jgi:TolA-binding protein
MIDPPRLLEGADEFQRALLSSSRRDVGSTGAEARCIAAVGASAALATASAASGAGLLIPLLKAGSVGLLLGLMASGAGLVASRASAPAVSISNQEVKTRLSAVRRIATPTEGPRRPASASEPEIATVPPAEVSAHAAAQMRTLAPKAAAPSLAAETDAVEAAPGHAPDHVLEREVRQLDRARQFLAESNTRAAAQALDDYDHEFSRGTLAPEALFLRVQTLIAEGRGAEAGERGRRFLAAHPTGAAAQKLTQVLERAHLL